MPYIFSGGRCVDDKLCVTKGRAGLSVESRCGLFPMTTLVAFITHKQRYILLPKETNTWMLFFFDARMI